MTTNLPHQQFALQATEHALQQASALYQSGNHEEAAKRCLSILETQPDHAGANHMMGVMAVQLRQHDTALPYLMAALNTDPACGQYWLSYIEALFQAGQLEAAREVLALARQQGLSGEPVEALAARLNNNAQATEQTIPEKENRAVQQGDMPSTREIDTMISLFSQGRYTETITHAQALAMRFPRHWAAWKMLGVVLNQLGRSAEALLPMQKAAALLPHDAETHNNLGITLQNLGQLEKAETCYRQALQINPAYAQAHGNLGSTLQSLKHPDEAEACYRQAIRLKPDYAKAYCNLGALLQDTARLAEAEANFRQALLINPDYAEAHNNLGLTLQAMGHPDQAEDCYRQAVRIQPDFAEAYLHLGDTLKILKRLSEAEACYRQALQIDPSSPEALACMGSFFKECGQLKEAENFYRQALQIKPDYAEVLNNLGSILSEYGYSNEAETHFRRALQIKPDFAEALVNLGNTLKDTCRLDEAENCYRRAIRIQPDHENIFSNLLFVLNYHPDKSAEEIFETYREYDREFGLPYRNEWRPHGNSTNTSRRLRVGYVSPDFREHSVRHFLEPLLARHNREMVEVYAYAELNKEDAATARYKNYVDQWIPTRGLTDEELTERIRADEIDVLVELAGHTAKNRLGVFARKPAPVSLSWWMGYGYSTGLTAIDYFLTNEIAAPAGSEGLFSEKPWRLPPPAVVYRPAENMGEPGPFPASSSGYITFGSLSRGIRINYRVIRAWSEILKRVENSRLIIDSKDFGDAYMQNILKEKFAAHGISEERLQLGFHSPPWDTLRKLDIGLDCFPHNSGTTLFETLYMGVPYVTLSNRPSVGRLGSAILEGIGHTEWIAKTEEEYIEKAVMLAGNFQKLAALRSSLRQEMQMSRIMDEAAFVQAVETAYRKMFEQWAKQ